MTVAETHLRSLDAGRDHRAHAAFTRLVHEPDAPIHANDMRPILDWMVAQLDQMQAQIQALQQRQDPVRHNPE